MDACESIAVLCGFPVTLTGMLIYIQIYAYVQDILKNILKNILENPIPTIIRIIFLNLGLLNFSFYVYNVD